MNPCRPHLPDRVGAGLAGARLDPTRSGLSVVVNMLSGSHSANVHPGPETRAIGYGSAQVLVPEYRRGTTEAPPHSTAQVPCPRDRVRHRLDGRGRARGAAPRRIEAAARHRPGPDRRGLGRRTVGHLKAQAVDARVWSGLTPNPKDHEIAAGSRVLPRARLRRAVALGGGSVIDAAKGIAILAANGGQHPRLRGRRQGDQCRSRRWSSCRPRRARAPTCRSSASSPTPRAARRSPSWAARWCRTSP